MTEKDNIKLKTDTLSNRKSSTSTGVQVKRKRKIINKAVEKKTEAKTKPNVSENEKIVSKTKSITPQEVNKNRGTAVPESKAPKKQRIDKDERNDEDAKPVALHGVNACQPDRVIVREVVECLGTIGFSDSSGLLLLQLGLWVALLTVG